MVESREHINPKGMVHIYMNWLGQFRNRIDENRENPSSYQFQVRGRRVVKFADEKNVYHLPTLVARPDWASRNVIIKQAYLGDLLNGLPD